MKFKLAFALHNHQPVGNFSAVFEEAHTKCYDPFLKLAGKYSGIRFSLHQSGILWNWQKEHHPEFFALVGEMVDRNQVELLSGGYYEPILPAIPDRDKTGQIDKLTQYLREHFEVEPRGMWLAERVWEPGLPKIIRNCGLHFLPLDDCHFKYCGLNEDQLYHPFTTEDEGKLITVLPILQKLRYLIPFGTPDEVIEFLKKAANDHPDGMAVYADDGEKFGVWPESFKHCHTNGWLEKFFEKVMDNSDWLEMIPLGEAVENVKPEGPVYLPSASYREMAQWSLPADSIIALEKLEEILSLHDTTESGDIFVRGGHWRGFLTKYPEANLMHKKMLAVSDLLLRAENKICETPINLDEIRDLLYAGQCNCPYWHGVFGGLYLPHLRWAIYKKLIRAEKKLRAILDKGIAADFEDRDCDGFADIVVSGQKLSMVITPQRGGQIVELVDYDRNLNLVDCLARRREAYHQKLVDLKDKASTGEARSIHDQVIAKEEGLEKLLVNDWYLRRPLTDHFLAAGTTLEDFNSGRYHELGDFILEPFASDFLENEDDYQISLTRQGQVWQGDYHCPMKLKKTITFPKRGESVIIDYFLVQQKLEIMPITFGVEFDFNLLAPDAEDRYAEVEGIRERKNSHLSAVIENKHVSKIAYHDEYQGMKISLEADKKCNIWRMPIRTVSLSESGFEKTFQGNCTVFVFEKALPAGEVFNVRFKMSITALDSKSLNNHSTSSIAFNG